MKVRYTTVNSQIIAENRGGVRKLYVPDALGSTVSLVDDTQTITDTFSYWPYGEVASRTGTTATALQYVGALGYFQDSVSRNYVRARSLDTQSGRWMTQDPIGFRAGDANLYRYASNQVVSHTDASGLILDILLLCCSGCLACTIDNILVCADCGSDQHCWVKCYQGAKACLPKSVKLFCHQFCDLCDKCLEEVGLKPIYPV